MSHAIWWGQRGGQGNDMNVSVWPFLSPTLSKMRRGAVGPEGVSDFRLTGSSGSEGLAGHQQSGTFSLHWPWTRGNREHFQSGEERLSTKSTVCHDPSVRAGPERDFGWGPCSHVPCWYVMLVCCALSAFHMAPLLQPGPHQSPPDSVACRVGEESSGAKGHLLCTPPPLTA